MPVINIPLPSSTPAQRLAELQRNMIAYERQQILAERTALEAIRAHFISQKARIDSQRAGISARMQRLQTQASTTGLTDTSARECALLREQIIQLNEDSIQHITQFEVQYTARLIQFEERLEHFIVLFGY